jgi:prepilin-type N-terminal cleavage/methylation domain-containing protein
MTKITSLRSALHDAQGQSGTTLIELVVVIAILAVVGTLVTSMMIATSDQSYAIEGHLQDDGRGALAMDVMTKTLRAAVQPAQLQIGCTSCTGTYGSTSALTSATATSVSFYADLAAASTGPSLVTLSASGSTSTGQGTLVETVQPPDPGSAPNYTYTTCTIGPGCDINQYTVATGLAWPQPSTLFTYYDATGTALTPSSSGLTSTQLANVDAIALALTVQTNLPGRDTPSTLTGYVQLTNSTFGVAATPSAAASF